MKNKISSLLERPPVVVIMGHIDHGKSTLLDTIRKTNLTAAEAGGITQRLSAYEIKYPTKSGEKKITFIDTPGHEAFAAMRSTGAEIADLAVLIVSAEDGVKAQTKEALSEILKHDLPYLVAINKIDKPSANISKVKQDLTEINVYLEGYGGHIPVAEISAKTGQGVPELLDLIILVAEMQELKGDPRAPAEGFVLEASLNPQAGVSGLLIIKQGVLRTGDYLAVNDDCFKIKRLSDFLNQPIEEADFSAPVKVIGFKKIPQPNARFRAFTDKKQAEKCQGGNRSSEKMTSGKTETIAASDSDQTRKMIMPISLKTDTANGLDALEKEVTKLNTEEIKLLVIARGIGDITENDVKLAGGSANSLIVGFNVRTDKAAKELAEKNNLTIQTFDVIYKLSEWLAAEIKQRTPKTVTEEVLGRAKILKIFSATKDKQVVGGTVIEGLMVLGKNFRLWRRETNLAKGKILELETQKVKTKEVAKDKFFGALIECKLSLAAGDVLEIFDFSEK